MPHHVVVDGSNLATEGRTAPSLKQLNEAVLAYMAEDPTALITVVVDATASVEVVVTLGGGRSASWADSSVDTASMPVGGSVVMPTNAMAQITASAPDAQAPRRSCGRAAQPDRIRIGRSTRRSDSSDNARTAGTVAAATSARGARGHCSSTSIWTGQDQR